MYFATILKETEKEEKSSPSRSYTIWSLPVSAIALYSLSPLAHCIPATLASLLLKHTELICILQSFARILIQGALPVTQHSVYI